MSKEMDKYRRNDMRDLRKEFDDLVNFKFPGSIFDRYFTTDTWAPLIDIEESKDSFNVKAEIPGMKKEDIKITVDHNTLVIEGERKSEKEETNKTYHRIERSYGKFYRAIGLPREIDETGIKAKYEDGVLQIELPKSEKLKSKQIEIK